MSARGFVEVDARPKRAAAEHPDFVGAPFYRPAIPFRERAPRWVRCLDVIGLLLLVLAGLALASTSFTPAQLKQAWMFLPFGFPLMMRVCAWCDEIIGEKCELCGSEAKEVTEGVPAGSRRFRCVAASCGLEFEREMAKATHGICPRCSAKKASESVPAKPAAKAVSA